MFFFLHQPKLKYYPYLGDLKPQNPTLKLKNLNSVCEIYQINANK